MFFDVATKIFKDEAIEANKIAFVAADKYLTWQELKELSNKICAELQKAGLQPGEPVLIYGDKEVFCLAAILSCFRLELPFVPVNPSLPQKRLEKIIEQTKSRAIIICRPNEGNAPALPIVITSDLNLSRYAFPQKNILKDVAYILFTSGSSGEPKGVMISYENIISFAKWFTEKFHVNKTTVFINQAELSFDIALADFFGTLQTGGTAIFNTSETSTNTISFFERINKYKGNYWNSTPSFILRCLADKNFNAKSLPTITQFVLSGEILSGKIVIELKKRFPNARIINAYGPTETCIYASFAEVTDEVMSERSLPISKTDNPSISITDGEIIISGDRVGLGYLNKDELTKARFFSFEKKRSFHSGDNALVKNGYIYYAGRKDEQIKFNGFRIEPAEIKHVIEKIEFVEVAECIPLIIDERVKRLVAFVKLKAGGVNLSAFEILETLKKELPSYMIPSEIIFVKEFPLTPSTKIDRKKLLQDYLSN